MNNQIVRCAFVVAVLVATELTSQARWMNPQLGRANIFNRVKEKVTASGTNVERASVQQIWTAHRSVYEELNHPEWAEAIYDAYFQSRGISY